MMKLVTKIASLEDEAPEDSAEFQCLLMEDRFSELQAFENGAVIKAAKSIDNLVEFIKALDYERTKTIQFNLNPELTDRTIKYLKYTNMLYGMRYVTNSSESGRSITKGKTKFDIALGYEDIPMNDMIVLAKYSNKISSLTLAEAKVMIDLSVHYDFQKDRVRKMFQKAYGLWAK